MGMQDGTKRGVVALLKSDSTLTAGERQRLIAAIDGGGHEQGQKKQNRKLVFRRAEVAEMLGRSTRYIDSLARRGLLRRARLPGRKRAVGIIAADVERLVAISAGDAEASTC